MSEIPFFGRNPIYMSTLAAFVLLQLAVIYAQNFGMLLAFRFITGFIGSPVLATGGASIADMFVPQKQVYGISIWGVSAVLGPALGPLVGGFAVESEGWQWGQSSKIYCVYRALDELIQLTNLRSNLGAYVALWLLLHIPIPPPPRDKQE